MSALTIKQMALRLSVSPSTVRDMIRDGRIGPEYVIQTTATTHRVRECFFDVPGGFHKAPTADEIADAVLRKLAGTSLRFGV